MITHKNVSIAGFAGTLCLLLFLGASLAPQKMDALFRPYGLFIWFGVLAGAIILPVVGAYRSSKYWLVITGVALLVAAQFFVRVFA